MTNFEKAFAAARKAGKKEFSWNGKQYNTKLKEEVKKTRSGIGDKALISPPRRGQAPEPIVFRPKKQGPKGTGYTKKEGVVASAVSDVKKNIAELRKNTQADRDARRKDREAKDKAREAAKATKKDKVYLPSKRKLTSGQTPREKK